MPTHCHHRHSALPCFPISTITLLVPFLSLSSFFSFSAPLYFPSAPIIPCHFFSFWLPFTSHQCPPLHDVLFLSLSLFSTPSLPHQHWHPSLHASVSAQCSLLLSSFSSPLLTKVPIHQRLPLSQNVCSLLFHISIITFHCAWLMHFLLYSCTAFLITSSPAGIVLPLIDNYCLKPCHQVVYQVVLKHNMVLGAEMFRIVLLLSLTRLQPNFPRKGENVMISLQVSMILHASTVAYIILCVALSFAD